MYITKSDYILWKDCPHNSWLKKWKPDVYNSKPLSDFEKHLIEEGGIVEETVRGRFPEGILIPNRGREALDQTKKLLEEKPVTLFQSAFSDGTLFAAVDILKQNINGKLSIYEVKASNAEKQKYENEEDYIEGDSVVDLNNPKALEKYKKQLFKDIHFFDLSFQVYLANKTGHKIDNAYLVRLNRNYVRRGALDLQELFVFEDVASYINEALPAIEEEIQALIKLLSSEKEPKGPCCCLNKGRSKHCTSFVEFNRDIPEYGIHDLVRIGKSKKTLEALVDAKIYEILDIPSDFEITSKGIKRQVETHKLGKPQIDFDFIRKELSTLKFPLYFLDYETFNPAIPRFTGFKPYQHIPFQFSLHRLDSLESELVHSDFFYDGDKDPSPMLAEALRKEIGNKGSVFVWNRTMEESHVNKHLAERLPEYADFLNDVNSRMFDLMNIFAKQAYIHPEFHGKYSIKKVLPVLCGKTYDDMEIGSGSEAMNTWNRLVTTEVPKEERNRVEKLMKEYCCQDTESIHDIWKVLQNVLNKEVAKL